MSQSNSSQSNSSQSNSSVGVVGEPYVWDSDSDSDDDDSEWEAEAAARYFEHEVRLEIECVIEELIGNHSEEYEIDEESPWSEVRDEHPEVGLQILEHALDHFESEEEDNKKLTRTKEIISDMEHFIRDAEQMYESE